MALAKIVAGAPVELQPGRQVEAPAGKFSSWAAVIGWTEEARNALGLWTIVEPEAVPADKIVTATALEGTGPVTRTRTLADRPPPDEVDPLPFRLALRQLGHYDAVVAWVNAQGGQIGDAWVAMNRVKRGNAMFVAAQAALELTNEQVDEIFVTAEAIASTL